MIVQAGDVYMKGSSQGNAAIVKALQMGQRKVMTTCQKRSAQACTPALHVNANACCVRAHKRRRQGPSFKKSVSFEDGQNQRFEYHVTKEDQKNSWYSKSDYVGIREDNHATVLSVRLGVSNLIQPEEFCLRGLEAIVAPEIGRTRIILRQVFVASVLQEQQTQRLGGVENDGVMGELSKFLSYVASEEAVQVALVDAHQGQA